MQVVLEKGQRGFWDSYFQSTQYPKHHHTPVR